MRRSSFQKVDAENASVDVMLSRDIVSQYDKIAAVSDKIDEVVAVADSVGNVATVATNIGVVTAIGTHIDAIVEVNDSIADVHTVADNIATVNQVASNVSNIASVANEVIPNIAEILQADTNAATATTMAATATAQAGLASTARVAAEVAQGVAETKADEANLSMVAADISADLAAASASVASTKANDASASATAAHNSELAAAAILDSFDDRYLGAFASNPTADNDGNALTSGALYFNTTTHNLKVYDAELLDWIALSDVTFAGLQDVNLTNVATGDVLKWNGTDWVNTKAVGLNSLQLLGGVSTQGTMTWNAYEETVDVVQNGAVLQLGQETQVHVRNNSGSSIADGKVVMATGALGASGRITAGLYDGTADVKYVLGVATETIADGDDGKVTSFGKIRGINTSAWNEGDVLYAATAGGLTNVAPTTDVKLAVAMVITKHAINGVIMVRVNGVNELAYQPLDATLTALAGVTTAADKMIYSTGADTFTTTTVSSFARMILDDADAAAVRTTIGAQPLDADLTAIAALAGTSGLLKKTATDTWTLDTNSYVTSSGVTSVTGTAPIVSSGGTAPAISISAATTSAAGSMSAADKTKLDGIATSANNYVHPTTDGNLHVPATGTANSGKVLTAGATAGSLSWTTIPAGVTDHTLLSNIGTNTHAQIDTALTRLVNTSGTNTGDQTNITGNAQTATILLGDESNWATYRSRSVANMLSWKNYGNGHCIFDASNGTAPNGVAVNNINPSVPWSPTSPILMGWNGDLTFGVRVDSARVADSATTATTAGSCTGNSATATTATNVNGGTVNATTGTFSGELATATQIVIGTGGDNRRGAIYSDANWGMFFRAKVDTPNMAHFVWIKGDGSELFRHNGTALTTNITGNSATATTASSCTGNSATATLASDSNKLIGKNWYWSGQDGQPAWLWGGSDGTNMYVYNPANFVVYRANDLGNHQWASHAGSGFIRLSTGLIIQWGVFNNTAASVAITFPLAFPSACVNVIASTYYPGDTGGLNTIAAGTSSLPSKTGVSFTTYSNAGVLTYWTAIGY